MVYGILPFFRPVWEPHLKANVQDVGVGGVAAVLAALQALVCHAQAVEFCVLYIGDVVGVLVALSAANKPC